MNVPYFHVDAFTRQTFTGNPAGVCLLDEWLPDAVLQKIAAENNLSETAFLVGSGDLYRLRWFTPSLEIDLCGHATLAAAFVLHREKQEIPSTIKFETRSGTLSVVKRDNLFIMDFPSRPATPCHPPEGLIEGLGAKPLAVLKARDFMAVFERQEQIKALRPDFEKLARLDCLGIIATAPGEKVDFVSRFFAPAAGIPEDPVTGSSHCTLVPYWAAQAGKKELTARQISKRGGELFCSLSGDRVLIGGEAVVYKQGKIFVTT